MTQSNTEQDKNWTLEKVQYHIDNLLETNHSLTPDQRSALNKSIQIIDFMKTIYPGIKKVLSERGK